MSELGKMREKMRQVLRERAAFPLAHPLEETLDQILKMLVEWLLEEGYLYSARDEGSQEEGLLLPMEAWQALCKELGVK